MIDKKGRTTKQFYQKGKLKKKKLNYRIKMFCLVKLADFSKM